MKTVIQIFLVVFLFSLLLSCSRSEEEIHADYMEILGGEHELRKFNVTTNNSSTSHTWYFLVAGGYSTSSSESAVVRFYFLNCKGEYQLKELYLNDVNIKIDNSITNPYVKFYWNESSCYKKEEYSDMYDYEITRAVIYCADSAFQPEININDLK